MKYIAPSIKAEETQAVQVLAASLTISDTTVSGDQALTKEDAGWSTWDEDEE